MDEPADDETGVGQESSGPGGGETPDPPAHGGSTEPDRGGDPSIAEIDHVDEAIDENDPSDAPSDDDPTPDRFNRVRRSTAGAMMTGIAIGFQQVFDRPKQDIPFVIKASSDPGDPDNPIDLQFDPDDPTKTVAIIRATPPSADPAEVPKAPDDGGD